MSNGVLLETQEDISLESCFASPVWFETGCEHGAGLLWMERVWVSLCIALLSASNCLGQYLLPGYEISYSGCSVRRLGDQC